MECLHFKNSDFIKSIVFIRPGCKANWVMSLSQKILKNWFCSFKVMIIKIEPEIITEVDMPCFSQRGLKFIKNISINFELFQQIFHLKTSILSSKTQSCRAKYLVSSYD